MATGIGAGASVTATTPRNPSSLIPTVGNVNNAAQNFWKLTPRQRQVFLKNHGYNITVDGLPGPQTLDASKAWLAGVSPSEWNRRRLQPGGGRAPASNVSALGPRQPNTVGVGSTPTPRAPTAPTSAASPINGNPFTRAGMGLGPAAAAPPQINIPNTSPASLLGDLGSLGYVNIDPNQYAQTIANLQYDGPIAELIRQRQLAESRGIGAQTSLTDWFNQLQDQKNLGIADREAAFSAGKTGLEAAGKGLMAAFGGGANDATPVMGADVLNQVAGLTGLNQAASNFDNRLGAIFGSQEADAKNAARLTTEQQLADLAAQLVQMRADKGNAQAAALYQGYGLNQDMMGNAIGMLGQIRGMDSQTFQNRLAQARFGQDWTTQQIQNQGAIQNQNIVGALAPAQIAQANASAVGAGLSNAQAALDYRTTQAQFRQWLQQHNGRGQIMDPTGNPLSAPQLNAFADKIVHSLLDATGKPTLGSNAAFGQITSMIRGSGLDITQPAVQQFRQMVLRTLYPGVTFGPKGNPVRSH